MLRHKTRLIAPGERGEATKMLAIERLRRPDRQPDAMQRKRIESADRFKAAMGRPAGAHIVLGVDFEEPQRRPVAKDFIDVLRLQANPTAVGQR